MPSILDPKDILARLVAFPTVSNESNLDLIAWIESLLTGWGVEFHRVPNADGTKSSLYAVIGPKVEGGIVLSGHTDVVPVDGQDWTSDPFRLHARNGRLHGRGAVDMKAFVALSLAAAQLGAGSPLRRPLYLALSYDEETGCEGCIDMVSEMARLLPKPAAVFVGEPTEMDVINGHKGSLGLRIDIKGYEVHAALAPYGVNANMEAGRLINWANDVNDMNRSAPPRPAAIPFDPAWTTAQVGRIQGGFADNITAGHCWMTLGFRVVPGEEIADWEARVHDRVDEIRTSMQRTNATADIRVSRLYVVPPLACETDGKAERIARSLTGRSSKVVSFGTEAGHFQRHGWSTVVCGPGDIAQAHKADEFIEESQFEAGLKFMKAAIQHLQDE